MGSKQRMFPITLMLDERRRVKLKDASRSTRISMSELVRISVDRLISEIGDPKRPDVLALAAILGSAEPRDRTPEPRRDRKPKK